MTYNAVEVDQSPINVIEGGTHVYKVEYPSDVTVDGTSWVYAYKNSTDVSSAVLTGSLSGSGKTLTLKTISGLQGGNDYRIVWAVTCLGQTNPKALTLKVQRKSGR
jgi:hypothetical protein